MFWVGRVQTVAHDDKIHKAAPVIQGHLARCEVIEVSRLAEERMSIGV